MCTIGVKCVVVGLQKGGVFLRSQSGLAGVSECVSVPLLDRVYAPDTPPITRFDLSIIRIWWGTLHRTLHFIRGLQKGGCTFLALCILLSV